MVAPARSAIDWCSSGVRRRDERRRRKKMTLQRTIAPTKPRQVLLHAASAAGGSWSPSYGPLEAVSEVLDVMTRATENLLQSIGRLIGLGGGENEEDDAEARNARRLLIRFFTLAFALPWVVSTTLRVALFTPAAKAFVPPSSAFVQPTEHQKDEMASKLAAYERRMWYDSIAGYGLEYNGGSENQAELRERAHELELETRLENRRIMCNCAADISTFIVFAVAALTRYSRVVEAKERISESFLTLETSTQAFLLLMCADVLVGYHSGDGWTAMLNIMLRNYGLELAEDFLRIFVAVVPVAIDVTFKYWVFKYLRSLSPSTQIILSEIERH